MTLMKVTTHAFLYSNRECVFDIMSCMATVTILHERQIAIISHLSLKMATIIVARVDNIQLGPKVAAITIDITVTSFCRF